jgi:hypothetical protein
MIVSFEIGDETLKIIPESVKVKPTDLFDLEASRTP